jgi:hypothetical protein
MSSVAAALAEALPCRRGRRWKSWRRWLVPSAIECPAAAIDDGPSQQQTLSPRAPPCHPTNDSNIWNAAAAAIPSLFGSGGGPTLQEYAGYDDEQWWWKGAPLRSQHRQVIFTLHFLGEEKNDRRRRRAQQCVVRLVRHHIRRWNSCGAKTREYESSSLLTAVNRQRRCHLTYYSSCTSPLFTSLHRGQQHLVGIIIIIVVPPRMRGRLILLDQRPASDSIAT